MSKEKEPKEQPFVSDESRPDLTVDLNQKVGELSVRDLASILGAGSQSAIKVKEVKEIKDIFKERKDAKDAKDHKDPKEHKDQKDHKDTKDHKDPKDQKDHKDPKDHKDHKDQKDRKDIKDIAIEKNPTIEVFKDLAADTKPLDNPGDPVEISPEGLQDLVRRVSGLEAEMAHLRNQSGGGGAKH
jgi:ABC-type Zn2+ transport system substrate-binding protein/surface adhesin